MSRQSYYEIALTQGQVLVAFGLLVICILGSFVGGAWVAKSALARDGVVDTAEPVEPADGIRFFGGGDAERKADEGGSGATAPTTGGSQPTPPPATEPSAAVPQTTAQGGTSAASKPAATQSKTPSAAQPKTSSPQRSPATTPAASPPEERPATTPRRTPATASPSSSKREPAPTERPTQQSGPREVDPASVTGLPVVQVLSTSQQSQASQLARRLKAGGFKVFVSPVQVDGRSMFRVRVGPFATREEAVREAGKLKAQHQLDTWVTTN